MRRRITAEGFTLLEVLIAMAVLSIALVAVFELFSAGLRGMAASVDYVEAVVKAEAKMREILDDEDMAEKSWQETSEDGYRFDASIKKTEEDRTDNLPVELLDISLTVSWSRGIKDRTLKLKTLKLVNKKV
ncbi:MAG: type II secretion system protein [Thermodesulfovibrionales bacterium]